MSDYWVTASHGGVKRDAPPYGAVLFLVDCDDGLESWIPRSQLQDYDEDSMIIPRWLAEDRGIEYE